jgi:hypothetical protein
MYLRWVENARCSALEARPIVRRRRGLAPFSRRKFIDFASSRPSTGGEPCVGVSLFWCITCDGYENRGRNILVVGHSDAEAAKALQLHSLTGRITLLTNSTNTRSVTYWCVDWRRPASRWSTTGSTRCSARRASGSS